ncbi:high mobility group B protein 9-like isoform X2 [Asparagus officinalis]|uniref:high mobility group B protein 9-like isoform X2 n=1 Tax=Asparagus officinalis TaxID=4686 RepID=UPI00098E3FBC|nr:high mobility group B protein 9-like isoform X2 [Asparagus officinalis]
MGAELREGEGLEITERGAAEGLEMTLGVKSDVSMANDVHPKVYPPPLLSHVEVSTNPIAFYDTLRRLHSALGSRFMIPVIGGKELNLHQLYVQVTQRGGLEKVILERRWRDVIATFDFPPTTTSASFVLRKYYLSLLHHYEQLYFFRTQGPLVAPSVVPAPAHIREGHVCLSVDNASQSPILVGPRPSIGSSSAAAPLTLDNAQTVVPAPAHIRERHMCLSVDNAPQSPIPIGFRPSIGSSSAAVPLSVDKAQTVMPAIPRPIKGHEPGEASYVAKAPAIVEDKTVTYANGVLGSHSAASAPTSGESTPTAEKYAVSNADGHQATPSGPISTNPTLAGSSSTGVQNLSVSGTIDGKFEHGYFVSVRVGTQVLHGVLYHAHPLDAAYSSLHQSNYPTSGTNSLLEQSPSNVTDPYIPQTRSSQRRKKYKNRAPGQPKPNRSAYNFFFAEEHAKLKVEHPRKERQYSKMIGDSWSKLTEEERGVYDAYGKRDKERYRRELQAYRERMGLAQPRGVLRVRRP